MVKSRNAMQYFLLNIHPFYTNFFKSIDRNTGNTVSCHVHVIFHHSLHAIIIRVLIPVRRLK